MSDTLVAIILGLVEGLTEFLPVSSTGHLLLAERVLPRQSDLFNIVIQSAAVCAILVVFWGRLVALAKQWRERQSQIYLAQLAVAFAITAAGGLVLKHLQVKLPESVTPVAWATLVGGVLFIAVELGLKRRASAAGPAHSHAISWAAAVAMGAGQLVAAIFPGASRSGTTILLALVLGSSRAGATEFSFLLGVPTLLAAGAVQAHGALAEGASSIAWGPIAWASLSAGVTAFVVVRWLLTYVRQHTFIVFGVYRIVLGLALLLTPEPSQLGLAPPSGTGDCPAVVDASPAP